MPKKPARRSAVRRPRVSPVSSKSSRAPIEARLTLDVRREGLEPILGAAYLMMDRAYVLVEGDKKRALKVTLRPKSGQGAAAVAAAFRAELAAQKLRWAVARGNRPVREYVAEHALALATEFEARAGAAAEPAAEQLTTEQRSEIERLIAEVETEIAQMNSKKEHADPKGVGLSWEAKADAEKGGSAA